MLGLMQDWPLLCHTIIDHAALQHGGREVVTRSVEGPIHRTNYAEIRARALRVAKRLEQDGIKLGDRVATLAWNTWRHLEAWYGITGIGAIYQRQPAAVPRADRLDHQSRRRPDDVRRPDLRAAARKDRRQAADRRALRRADRRRAHAGDDAARTRSPTRTGSPRSTASSPGRSSTRTPPPASATPRARPAIPRACSIRTAPTCCTPDGASRRTPWASRRATRVLPVVPMFHANAWALASPRRWRAPSWSCRARSSTAPRSTSCSRTSR